MAAESSAADGSRDSHGWPRTCCVYCGARIVKVYDSREGHWYWPRPRGVACARHASLVSLDPHSASPVGDLAVTGSAPNRERVG